MKCGCPSFESENPCLVCDKGWEHHQVVIETRDERLAAGKLVDESYLPKSANIGPIVEEDNGLSAILPQEEIKTMPAAPSYQYNNIGISQISMPMNMTAVAGFMQEEQRMHPDKEQITMMRRASAPVPRHLPTTVVSNDLVNVARAKKIAEKMIAVSSDSKASKSKSKSKKKHYFY
jgi:hypothetical protein